jgi:DNA polymerase
VGKTTILGCGYGMGSAKFKLQLETMGVSLSSSECASIVYKYRDQFSHIPALWTEGDKALDALMSTRTAPLGKHEAVLVDMFGVRLPNGMYLRYDNLRKERDPKSGRDQYVYDVKKGRATLPTYIYGGKLIENVCQALARIIIGEQMLMVARKYRVVMTVHDAVGVIAPIEEADKARAFVEACMRMRPKWAPTLPLNCESKIGASYGG